MVLRTWKSLTTKDDTAVRVNNPTAGAQAFLMNYPFGEQAMSPVQNVQTTANVAGTNG
jgi:hypothetical protein